MNVRNWITAFVASAMLLAGCGGGGGDPGTSPFGGSGGGGGGGGGTTSSVTAIDVATSSLQMGTGGSESVTITAVVKGAGSVVLKDQTVTLVASSGSLVVANATTDAAGMVKATLTPGSDKSNRNITVTATSGTISGNVTVQVNGTTASYSGPTSLSSGSTPSTLSILVKDSNGAVISGAAVTVSSSLGNAITPSASTNGNGSASFSYTPTNAGTDNLVFSVLGTSVSATLVISGQDFTFVSPAASTATPVGNQVVVRVRYRLSGSPVSGEQVNFASTAGTFVGSATATTDGAGEATATLSSTFAGSATVTATISGVGTVTLPLRFIAVTPANLVLQASPNALGFNLAGSTTNQSTLLARVTDASGNPVQGQTVNFSRSLDGSGGDLSVPSAVTNANGEASVNYIAGPQSTSVNGVVITASVALQGGGTVSNTASLTVNQSPLFIGLGTNNEITNTMNGVTDPVTYFKAWTVYVTDANGAAKPGVTVTMRVQPLMYAKGTLVYDDVWDYTNTQAATSNNPLPDGEALWCQNEDLDLDGIRDSGEDTNGNGILDPGNVIALTPSSQSVVTDSNGSATIYLRYAESYAPWVYVKLIASASVSGTEARKETSFVVSGSSEDFSSENIPPAGVVSPFGFIASCANPN